MRSALTLGEVYALSYCGKGNIGSVHLKSHIVSQGVQHRGLNDEPLTGQCAHSHSYHHNLGKYSHLFLARHLRRLGIQGFDNPFAWQVLAHPSSLDVARLCRELDWLYLLQQTWQLLLEMVACLSAYPLVKLKSWLASLVSKGYQLKSVCPCDWLRFLPLPLVAWRGYLACFLKLNQVAYPYIYSTINGSRL